MRRALDLLYMLSGASAALFLVLICAVVTAQVGLNAIDRIASATTGSAIGLTIPSYSSFAGVFLAASSFLALAYALRHGAHIRVSLVLQALPPRARRAADLVSVGTAAAFSAWFAWSMGVLVAESVEFGDVTPGIVPIPLWLPQTAMTFGVVVLTVALLDDLAAIVRGEPPAFDREGDVLSGERSEG
jgi:TRAP-type C4-dicarboxylate transport system permease small subunit